MTAKTKAEKQQHATVMVVRHSLRLALARLECGDYIASLASAEMASKTLADLITGPQPPPPPPPRDPIASPDR